MNSARITFEPSFVEEAVYLTVKREESAGHQDLAESFYEQRNRVYEESAGERENSFRRFYDQQFSNLGLQDFFDRMFTEFPLLDDSALTMVVRRVWNQRAEGAELFVQGGLKTVLLGIRTSHFLNLSRLEAFLRHELMHISDMLDPNFHYSPDVELGGAHEIENNLIRDRFRILWDLYVSARMKAKGFQGLIPFARQRQNFERAFSILDLEGRDAMFETVVGRKQWTQEALLRFAR